MYGMDFGTSNTVVTVRDGAKSRVLSLGSDGVIPSLLYFERDRRPSVGAEAVRDYTEALRLFKNSSNLYNQFRFFQAIKLALKDPFFQGTQVFGTFWPAESLAGLFLREVKRQADLETGIDAREVVLGRPVKLGTNPESDALLQERFRKACEFAGFSDISFVLEPVGAAVSMLGKSGASTENVLVFDFGGGTLDISVAKMSGGSVDILASGGCDLGGYILNEDISRARIIDHFGFSGKFRTMTGRYLDMPKWITDQVASFYALPLADISMTRKTVKELIPDARQSDKPKLKGLMEFLDRNMAFGLFREIDDAKILLSTREDSAIQFLVPPHLAISEALSRTDFQGIIQRHILTARNLVLDTLASAGARACDIDAVVRVGGSSRIPLFIDMLEELFPRRVSEGEVFTSIASGLLEARDRGFAA